MVGYKFDSIDTGIDTGKSKQLHSYFLPHLVASIADLQWLKCPSTMGYECLDQFKMMNKLKTINLLLFCSNSILFVLWHFDLALQILLGSIVLCIVAAASTILPDVVNWHKISIGRTILYCLMPFFILPIGNRYVKPWNLELFVLIEHIWSLREFLFE